MTRGRVSLLVEGTTDAAVLSRLLEEVGLERGTVYRLRGGGWLGRYLAGFDHATRCSHGLVLRDPDHGEACAAALVQRLVPSPAPLLTLRVAVRETEAWILADRAGLARHLRIAPSSIPRAPDELDDPKRTLVNLARRSHSRAVREDYVPRDASTSAIGPGYAGRFIEFVRRSWEPRAAAESSPSLARCIAALERIESSD